MSSFIAAVLAILFFMGGLTVFRIVPIARTTFGHMLKAGAALRNSSLTDEQKQSAAQQAAFDLFGSFLAIAWRLTAIVLTSALPVLLMSVLGFVEFNGVLIRLLRWDLVLLSTVAILVYMFIHTRGRASDNDYSAIDRTLHRVAFVAPYVQRMTADLEDAIFRRQLEHVPDRPPIFITSLPRAGTTVLLNSLHRVAGVATHLYRDMPFVMAPVLWSEVSRHFRRSQVLRERAHGDGLMVGFDSPEAFEEILWHAFWPNKYKSMPIPLWVKADANDEAASFFRHHFRKIVALRASGNGQYLSKNNNNIARLDLIDEMFPDARIVVPFREPKEQAASLLRQHVNFLKLHQSDEFSYRYMRDVGHLEFGELHRPFAFKDFDTLAGGTSPDDPNYWLAYWVAAYREVLRHAENIHLVSHESLTKNGHKLIGELCNQIELDPGSIDFSQCFKPVQRRADCEVFNSQLMDIADDLYAALWDRRVCPNHGEHI